MGNFVTVGKRESDATRDCRVPDDSSSRGDSHHSLYSMTASDLPLDVLALILGEALDPQWLFCARAVCRLWASVCATVRSRCAVRASCVASLLAAASGDDPYAGEPEAAERWCLSMGASLTDAGAVMVTSGRRGLIDYAITRPRAHDVVSATMTPFESLTVAVVRLCGPKDVDAYLDTHPLAVIPDRLVGVHTYANIDGDGDNGGDDNDVHNGRGGLHARKRRQIALRMLRGRHALRFASARGLEDVEWSDRSLVRAQEMHSIARYMIYDPKSARNMLRDYGRHQKACITVDEALFLLARVGQLDSLYWTEQFEALIAEALGDSVLGARTVVDLLARSRPAMRARPFETPLLIRLYRESPLLASLRPLHGINVDNCPLLDPGARVDLDMDIALLQLASASPDTAMAHAAIDMVVSRALASAHRLMCHARHASSDDQHDLWTLALRARSAYKAADAIQRRTDAHPRHGACDAKGDCAVLAEARVRALEHGFMGEMWSDLFDLGANNPPNP
ncbi:F-box domain-containing protein [Pandoravirus kuranda]|uniref:F-box domain-containing protein n=1 Tax=Pandoravirus kuranda TaxID=3019033 RepID=A0AA95J7Y0_9VIRU|nr:F-box domain-containing protein [Pandoravirus kuranda]